MTPTLLSMLPYMCLALLPVAFWVASISCKDTGTYHLKNNVSDLFYSEIKYRHKAYLVDQLSNCEVIIYFLRYDVKKMPTLKKESVAKLLSR